MIDPPDDLDDLLAPPVENETPGLRDALRQRTSAYLVRVKWLRRGAKIVAVAAVFALGVGVGVWRAPERERVVTVREVETVAVPVPVVVPVTISASEPPAPVVTRTAAKLELDAEQADEPGAAASLYRQAGDVYLTRDQDYANAARCYRLFLARSDPPPLSPEPGDSWLLTSLKNASFKGKPDAMLPNG